jgi:hypothetical protein
LKRYFIFSHFSRVRSNNFFAVFKNVPIQLQLFVFGSPIPHPPHTKSQNHPTPHCSLFTVHTVHVVPQRCVWCLVCGAWCVVCGVWCVVCGVWCVVCGAYDRLQFELKIQEKRKTKNNDFNEAKGVDFLTSSIPFVSNQLIHLKISFHHPSEN